VVVRRAKNGFVLILTCVALTILLAFAALGVDVARMYVIKSELQAFTDAAALNAALQLTGATPRIAQARQAAAALATGPHAMKWDMGTKTIPSIAATFAQGSDEPDAKSWTADPKDPAGYRFVRVTASVSAPLVFLRMFQARDAAAISASSLAASTSGSARLLE